MNNKIFILHSSEIIIQGLKSIIKSHFDFETILLNSMAGLKNYFNIESANIIILVEAELYDKSMLQIANKFQKSSLVKVIKINSAQTKNHENNDSCLSIHTSKSKIIDLINRYLQTKYKKAQSKNSTKLTGRETDVLKQVAFGKTNKEIADELFISIHTVISHRKNITEKLGIKSISGLTVYAILNKLIDTSTIDPESLI